MVTILSQVCITSRVALYYFINFMPIWPNVKEKFVIRPCSLPFLLLFPMHSFSPYQEEHSPVEKPGFVPSEYRLEPGLRAGMVARGPGRIKRFSRS